MDLQPEHAFIVDADTMVSEVGPFECRWIEDAPSSKRRCCSCVCDKVGRGDAVGVMEVRDMEWVGEETVDYAASNWIVVLR
jgi:hypothetical protein